MSKTMIIVHKYRVKKPKPSLIQLFRKAMGAARFIHNYFLFELTFNYPDYLDELESRQCWGEATTKEEAKKLSIAPPYLTGHTLDSLLPVLKEKVYTFLQDPPSQILQKAAQNLEKTFIDFMKGKCGRPHFKRKGTKTESIRFPQGVKLDQNNCCIYLPKIGWVRYFDDGRRIAKPQEIKAATLVRTDDKYDICLEIRVECPEVKPIDFEKDKGTACDVGTKRLLTDETGNYEESLTERVKPLEDIRSQKLKQFKNKTKGSRAYNRLLHDIRKIDTKIVCIRNDVLHKVSSRIAKNHDYAVVEKLQIQNMTKSAKGTIDEPGKNVKAKSGLNRSILRQGWGNLFNMLEYKFKLKGGTLVKVSAQYTSQTCPKCGHVSKNNRISQSKFRCEKCGYENHADKVGATNVFRRAGRARIAGRVKHRSPE